MSEKKSRVESPKLKAGRCRYCGCTERTPCNYTVQVQWRKYATLCWWVDKRRTICSGRKCMRRARRDGLLPKLRKR